MEKKPKVTSMYALEYVLEGESRIKIVNQEGGKSYATIAFPAGTKIQIFVSKLPEFEEK